MRLTDEELASFPEKGRRDKGALELYRQHDFLKAYALHTDSRVTEHGYRSAVGSVDDWERHGDLQSKFLISKGLKPDHWLLDIGCGTGRLARKIVPYLSSGWYVGVEISQKAREYAQRLAVEEGWDINGPAFVESMDALGQVRKPFDYLWAFSVTVHLPSDIMRDVMRKAAGMMDEQSKFYFSFVPEKLDGRTGPKSYRHRLETYVSAAEDAGMSFKADPFWTGEQKIALSMLK